MRRPRRSKDFKEYSVVKRIADSEIRLDWYENTGTIGVALIFPSSYEVAGSSLAFHYVRDLLSRHPLLRVERFFLESEFEKFYSLDSLRPLDEFRIWAFSVHFELDVLNVLEILKRKSIPLRWKDRDDSHPLVIVGGALTYFNPSSLYEVADAVYNCELELFLDDFTEALTKGDRVSILETLTRIPSVTVPPLGKEGLCAKAHDIDSIPPVSSVVPGSGEFSGMLLLEVGRGCIRRCAFCVAGHTQKPVRFMKIETIRSVLERVPVGIELGLISATITDYPWLDDLLDLLAGRRFSVSSMRMDGLSERLLRMLRESGQKSFTVAPEGGSQKIRDVLMKDITHEDIERALLLGKRTGFKRVKMYFIYGLEEETEEDLMSIVEIAEFARSIGYDVKLSLNPLIPKPATPFQARKMQPLDVLKSKESFLKKVFKEKKIRHDFESTRESAVQWMIANSTVDLSKFIVDEFEKGGKKRVFKTLLSLADELSKR